MGKRIHYIKLSLLLFILNFSVVFSNNTRIDSLNNVIEISEDSLKFNTYIELAKNYYYNNNFFEAIKTIREALYLEGIDKVRIARANNFLGLIYYNIGDHPIALKYHLISLRLREETNDKALIAVAQNSIAVVYTALNNPTKSNYYLKKALEVEIENNNTKNIAMIYNNISNNYALENNSEKALEYLLKSEAIIDQTDLDKSLLLVNIGKEYSKLGRINKAKYYYNTVIDYCKQTNNDYYLSLAYKHIGNLYLGEKDYKQAQDYYYQSLIISEKIKVQDVSKECYMGLIEVYTIDGELDSVAKYNRKYLAINDSIFNTKAAEKIAELQIKYEFDKKEKEIENLIIKNQLSDKKQKIIIFTFLSAILLLAIIFLIIYNKKQKSISDKLAVKQSVKIIKYEDVIDNSIVNSDNPIELPKDNNSTISEEFKTMLEVSISKKIMKDKLYLKNDFTLNELAKLLETNRRYVSQVINERFEQNFNSFINGFRIKEAMRLMSNPEYDKFTIDSISKQVGFNSISAFNGAFKKVTGVTPSTFVKSLKS